MRSIPRHPVRVWPIQISVEGYPCLDELHESYAVGVCTVYKHCSIVYSESWRHLLNNDLVTFTWPGAPPLQVLLYQFFEFLPARWKEFLSIWPANLAQNAVEGISPGQVNVTRIAHPVILERM